MGMFSALGIALVSLGFAPIWMLGMKAFGLFVMWRSMLTRSGLLMNTGGSDDGEQEPEIH